MGGFTENNGVCELSCAATQIFDEATSSCVCPGSTFLKNGACVSCSMNCYKCDVQQCFTCD